MADHYQRAGRKRGRTGYRCESLPWAFYSGDAWNDSNSDKAERLSLIFGTRIAVSATNLWPRQRWQFDWTQSGPEFLAIPPAQPSSATRFRRPRELRGLGTTGGAHFSGNGVCRIYLALNGAVFKQELC